MNTELFGGIIWYPGLDSSKDKTWDNDLNMIVYLIISWNRNEGEDSEVLWEENNFNEHIKCMGNWSSVLLGILCKMASELFILHTASKITFKMHKWDDNITPI